MGAGRLRCYHRVWYQRNRAAIMAKVGAWKRANPDKVSASNKRRYPVRKEKITAANDRWRLANPDRKRDHRENRRARERAAFVEDIERAVVYAKFDGRCGICGEPMPFESITLDHIIPLSRGGLHEYANVQPAHEVCNKSKGARVPLHLAG